MLPKELGSHSEVILEEISNADKIDIRKAVFPLSNFELRKRQFIGGALSLLMQNNLNNYRFKIFDSIVDKLHKLELSQHLPLENSSTLTEIVSRSLLFEVGSLLEGDDNNSSFMSAAVLQHAYNNQFLKVEDESIKSDLDEIDALGYLTELEQVDLIDQEDRLEVVQKLFRLGEYNGDNTWLYDVDLEANSPSHIIKKEELETILAEGNTIFVGRASEESGEGNIIKIKNNFLQKDLVSRYHGAFARIKNQLFYMDIGSGNGSIVQKNNRIIQLVPYSIVEFSKNMNLYIGPNVFFFNQYGDLQIEFSIDVRSKLLDDKFNAPNSSILHMPLFSFFNRKNS